MSNADRFLNSFIRIEKTLKNKVGGYSARKFYQLVEMAARIDRDVAYYSTILKEYAELRNAMVHMRDGRGEIIAIPTDATVQTIEMIADEICIVKRVSDYFLKSVVTCQKNDTMLTIQKIMEENDISKVPVYEGNEYLGIVTIEMIAHWACGQLTSTKQEEKVSECCLNMDDHRVFFLKQNATVKEVEDIFIQSLTKGIHVQAIIITAKGSRSEKPKGIITVQDLPLIMKAM